MTDWLTSLEAHWAWVSLGLLLAMLEMLVPGVYLIWLAVAALVTGLLTFALDLSLPMQIVDFVFLALIAVYSAKRILRDRPIESADPLMNQRTGRLVGEIAVVSATIEHGNGRVHVGDSDWIARGPDAVVGTRMRITGAQGAVLLVEPLALPSPADDTDGTLIEG